MDNIAISELSREECFALLRTTNLGHLTLTRRALPTVVPALYTVYRDRILIHASTGRDPVAWKDGEIVALHVGAFDSEQRFGWSVSVTGAAHVSPDLVGVENHPRAGWIADGGGDLVAISLDLLWGERLGVTSHKQLEAATSPEPARSP